MSVVRGFGLNGKSFYCNISEPKEVNLQFTVAATNGLGITSLKSNGYVQNVFMHTSTTPASNNGYLNPNPVAGQVMIQMKQNFNVFLRGQVSIIAPGSGSDVKIDNSAMVAGTVYTISVLGNATAAKWLAIGVPPGVTPAVGVSFVALSNGGAGNTLTSRVQAAGVSATQTFEFIGNPNVNITSNVGSNGGQFLYGQFLAPTLTTDAYGQPMIPTAPAAGSIVCMKLYFDGSTVSIPDQPGQTGL